MAPIGGGSYGFEGGRLFEEIRPVLRGFYKL